MTIETTLTKLIDDLEGVVLPQTSISKLVRLLTYLRDDAINLEYTSESNIQALLSEVLGQ